MTTRRTAGVVLIALSVTLWWLVGLTRVAFEHPGVLLLVPLVFAVGLALVVLGRRRTS